MNCVQLVGRTGLVKMFVRCLSLLPVLLLLLCRATTVSTLPTTVPTTAPSTAPSTVPTTAPSTAPTTPPPDSPLSQLFPPNFFVNKTTVVKQDIITCLREMKCPYDKILDALYLDKAMPYFPLQFSTSTAFVDVYNGNVVVLSLLYLHGWLDKMCADGIIKSLAHFDYCSELKTGTKLDETLLQVLSGGYSYFHFPQTLQRLANLKKVEECEDMCGTPHKSALCKAFTDMAVFLMDRLLAANLTKGVQSRFFVYIFTRSGREGARRGRSCSSG